MNLKKENYFLKNIYITKKKTIAMI